MTSLEVAPADLRRHVAEIVLALGARPDDARRVADALVGAELAGHVSHGVRQLPYYAAQVRSGELHPKAPLEVVEDAGSFCVLDGGYGFGHVVAMAAAELARERAHRHGVATVAVRNANHIGRLGEYTEHLAERGQIAILLATCEGAIKQVAPFGGIDRRLTNNPISFGVPGPDYPIVLDMALSAVAESRVLQAAERGVDVPAGWILDAAGVSSTRPADYVAGGTLVPVGGMTGGHKGYALIFLVELIVGLLSGGRISGPDDPRFSNGFVLIAIDAPDRDAARMPAVSGLIDWVKSARLAPGAEEIVVPGELEERRRRAGASALTLDATTVEELDRLALSVGLTALLGSIGSGGAG